MPERFVVDFTGKTLLGTYRIEQKLAEGGMGSVYLATDTNLERRVVVKVPHARFLGEPGFRARFGREISELVRLEHPHVVRILARGEEDGVPFFVLQYLGGGSLEGRLEEGAQTPGAALAWLEPIAKTLDFVHARGVVHRDVKPANILFDEEGHVFLSDFGVVKALDTASAPELTAAGTGIGSPIYMAPEQGLGRGVSGATDQYALAATLHEALAEEPPFGRGTPVEIILRKEREEPPSLAGRLVGWTPEADAVLRRALARDPAARHPSCSAFAAAFRAATEPPAADAATPRRKAWVALAAVFVAAVAVAAGTRWFGLLGAPPAPPAPPVTPTAQKPTDLILRVAETGREPRRLLRYQATKGARVVLSSVDTEKMTRTARKVWHQDTTTERDMEMTVRAVHSDGRARVQWIFRKARMSVEGDVSKELIERTQRNVEAVGDVTVEAVLWPNGWISDTVLRTEHEMTPAVAEVTAGMEQTVQMLSVTLPDVPIGPGAVWDMTRFSRAMGLRYQETVTFELLAVEGDVLKTRYSVVMTAPVQGVRFPAAPPDAKTTVKRFLSESSGTMDVDLRQPGPTTWAADANVMFVVSAEGEPDLTIEDLITTRGAQK